MSNLRKRMEALVVDPHQEAAEEGADGTDVDMKALAPQLLLAMQSMGLDPEDDEQLDAFLKTLKVLATSKANLLRAALRRWNPSRATKAVRTAKASL